MTIDAQAAAVNAIVAYLLDELGPDADTPAVAAVLKGWPENPDDLDLSGLPVISVTPGDPVRTDVAARSLGEVTADGVTTHTYRVADLAFVAQIDVWAAYKVQLEDVVPLVETALGVNPPFPAVRTLTSTDYHDRPVAVRLGPFRPDIDGDSAKKGEWRGTWDARVQSDYVRTTTHVPQTRVDLEITVDSGTAETLTVLEA